jgi:hypothetical protein
MSEPEGCLPDCTALEVVQSIDVATKTFSHRLRTKRAGQIELTNAALIGELRENRLKLQVSFKDEHGPGLYYNVHAVIVADEHRALFWKDYTSFCREVPLAVVPGGSVELGTIKDFSNEIREIRIIVWGRRN